MQLMNQGWYILSYSVSYLRLKDTILVSYYILIFQKIRYKIRHHMGLFTTFLRTFPLWSNSLPQIRDGRLSAQWEIHNPSHWRQKSFKVFHFKIRRTHGRSLEGQLQYLILYLISYILSYLIFQLFGLVSFILFLFFGQQIYQPWAHPSEQSLPMFPAWVNQATSCTFSKCFSFAPSPSTNFTLQKNRCKLGIQKYVNLTYYFWFDKIWTDCKWKPTERHIHV